jgi:hypothetical protein
MNHHAFRHGDFAAPVEVTIDGTPLQGVVEVDIKFAADYAESAQDGMQAGFVGAYPRVLKIRRLISDDVLIQNFGEEDKMEELNDIVINFLSNRRRVLLTIQCLECKGLVLSHRKEAGQAVPMEIIEVLPSQIKYEKPSA